MNTVFDSAKKIYENENKVKHIILFILTAIFTTLSSFYDIKTGQPDTWKQNPFDWVLSMLVAVYSIQFLHNCFANPEKAILPQWNEFHAKPILGLICINIVWSLYFFILCLLTFIWYAATNDLILPVLFCISVVILLPFIYYCFIEYAQNFSFKGILCPDILCKYIKTAFKPTIKVYLQYILVLIIAIIIYFMMYLIASIIGISEAVPIAKDYYLFDFIATAVFEYILNILLFFFFPYSLLQIFLNNIKSEPVENKEEY